MKRLIISFLFIGMAMLYFGCSEDNPVTPESNRGNQETSSLEKIGKTLFSGTSNFVKVIVPGTTTVLPNGKTLSEGQIVEWYDEASDSRVTGKTIWNVNVLTNEDGTGKYWGTTELIVDNNGGKWNMYWGGNLSPEGGEATAIGVGIEGDVKGLTAKWKYSLNIAEGFFYKTKGFIIEN